jgi:SAM-dependent methyltransferase
VYLLLLNRTAKGIIFQIFVHSEKRLMNCWICSSVKGAKHTASEKMLGLGGTFYYWECADCGCLFLMDHPDDWQIYYPPVYYSFAKPKSNPFTTVADRLRVSDTPVFSPLVNRYSPYPAISALHPIRKGQTLLDVGSGAGGVVLRLRALGVNALGIDPFIASDIYDGDRLRVKKTTLDSMAGTFDIVYLNHSFEHIPAQLETLKQISARLDSTGRAVIRMPLATEAWKIYGEFWYQLDAPRHLFLHTEKSLTILAGKAGLRIVKAVYDSDGRQFHYSSLYKKGLTMAQCKKARLPFLEELSLHRKAQILNSQKRGDMAAFTLIAS